MFSVEIVEFVVKLKWILRIPPGLNLTYVPDCKNVLITAIFLFISHNVQKYLNLQFWYSMPRSQEK